MKSEKVWTSLLLTVSLLLSASVAQAELPEGYVQVEYIESTVGGGQYIDTGVKASSTLQATMDYMAFEHTGDANLGTAAADSEDWRYFDYGGGPVFDCGNARCGSTSGNELDLDVRYVVNVGTEGKNLYLAVTDAEKTVTKSFTAACKGTPRTDNVFVFGGRMGGSVRCTAMRLYSLTLRDFADVGDAERTPLAEFVPCVRRSNGAVGLYDIKNGVFKGNAGSRTFVAAKNDQLATVTVPKHEHVIAYWTCGDGSVTNRISDASFQVLKGTPFKVMFASEGGLYKLVGPSVFGSEGISVDLVLTDEEVPVAGWLLPVKYIDADGSVKSRDVGEYELVTASTSQLKSGWYVVAGTVSRSSIAVSGDVKLILTDGCELTATGGDKQAGVVVSSGNSLTIYGQTAGTGTLTAKGGANAAGIGGGKDGACGTIHISGGVVTANGVYGGAGIGGGHGGAGGTITISGGIVSATAGGDAAGIGGGVGGAGGTITISGGVVTATGNGDGAGIGGGKSGAGGNVTISGGTVVARSGKSTVWDIGSGNGGGDEGEFTVTGGSVQLANSGKCRPDYPKNAAGTRVYCVTIPFPAGFAEDLAFSVTNIVRDGKSYAYGGRNLFVRDDGLYLYLPNGKYDIYLATGAGATAKATATVNGDKTTAVLITGAFLVNGLSLMGTLPSGCSYDSGVLTVNGEGPYVFSGSPQQLPLRVAVTQAQAATIILSNVVIAVRDDQPVLTVETGTTLTLQIAEGRSEFMSEGETGAIAVQPGANLVLGATDAALAETRLCVRGGVKGTTANVLCTDGVILKEGATENEATLTTACTGKAYLELGRSAAVTVAQLPGHMSAEIDYGSGTPLKVDPKGDVYTVMQTDNIKIRFTPDEGYGLDFTELSYGQVQGDLEVQSGDMPCGHPLVKTTYWDVNDAENPLKEVEAMVIDADTATLGSGWYVVTGVVSRAPIKVTGTDGSPANLILADGAKLTATYVDYHAGIEVAKGKALTIWGQKKGTGSLSATGGMHGAGIGGSDNVGRDCGEITINGGTVNATGGKNNAAGIGGGKGGQGGVITINGGTVTATGARGGSGIGGGDEGSGGTITINGGTVNAKGSATCTVSGVRRCGAGIGGGRGKTCGQILITGGTVTATGGSWEGSHGTAGIGGGNYSTGGTIQISGGVVTASGVSGGAGIGGGYLGVGCSVTISGGTVVAKSSMSTVCDIGSGEGGKDTDEFYVTGGSVHLANSGRCRDGYPKNAGGAQVYCVTNQFTGTFGKGTAVRIPSAPFSYGEKDIFTDGANQVYLWLPGAAGTYAIAYEKGDGTFEELTPKSVPVPGLVSAFDSPKTKVGYAKPDGTSAEADAIPVDENRTLLLGGNWYVVNNEVTMSHALEVVGSANLILADGAKLTVKGESERAGIEVADGNALTIWGQGEGTGELNATGGSNGAGIGGGNGVANGTVTINGGTVSAEGSGYGAGIGGGYKGAGGDVTISGGTVVAKSAKSTVWDIGSGSEGGYVGEFTVTGGSVQLANSGKCRPDYPKNGGGDTLRLVTVTVTTDAAEGVLSPATVSDLALVDPKYGLGDYNAKGVQLIGGKLYFYLETGRAYAFKVNDGELDRFVFIPASDGPYATTATDSVTVTVGEHAHLTAVWTCVDGTVTNEIVGTALVVPKGITGVKVIFTPGRGYRFAADDETGVRALASPLLADCTVTPPPIAGLPGTEANPWVVGEKVTAYGLDGGILVITGEGAMQDFADAADVPWNEVADEITAVLVLGDVTLGKNALALLSDSVRISADVTIASTRNALGTTAQSSAPTGGDFEAVEIVDGKAYLGVAVLTNSEVKVRGEGEGWGVATNGVIEVPAPGKSGYFILKRGGKR